jgi:RimJ/RimL family protein N-acetyltransferase
MIVFGPRCALAPLGDRRYDELDFRWAGSAGGLCHMLRGVKVALRAREEIDIAVLHAELYDDVRTRSRGSMRPWRPVAMSSPDSPYRVASSDDEYLPFSVVELASGELAGEASLWGLDSHNRVAHLGMSVRPSFRGRGLGSDVVAVLCEYGFTARGMHRLQIDTLADNAAMIRAATRNGFVLDGTLREAVWVYGAFVDEVLYGLLAADWGPRMAE